MIKELDFTTVDLILENAKLKLDVLAVEHNQKIKEVVRVEKETEYNISGLLEGARRERELISGLFDDYRKSLRFQNIAAQQSCMGGLMRHSNLLGLAEGVDRTVRL